MAARQVCSRKRKPCEIEYLDNEEDDEKNDVDQDEEEEDNAPKESSESSQSSDDFSDVSFSDYDDEWDAEGFRLEIPSTVLIVGPSKSGKSKFIEQMMVRRKIQPFPELIVICGPGSNQEERFSDLFTALRYGLQDVSDKPLCIKLASKISEAKRILESPKYHGLPKLAIFDDKLTSGTDAALKDIVTVTGHHSNVCVIITTQGMFVRDNPIIRTQTDTMIIFPLLDEIGLKRFMSGFPNGVFARVIDILSVESQKYYNDIKCDGETEDDSEFIPIPAIACKSRVGCIVYAGLSDIKPTFIGHSSNEEAGSDLVNKKIEKMFSK